MIDCLIIGFNDSDFEGYVNMVKSMGEDSGAFKDLDLAFIELNGKPYRSMDVINEFYFQDKQEPFSPFHNADFLWPVVMYLGSYLSKHNLSFDYVNLFQLEKEKLKERLATGDILTIAITTTLYVSPQPILEIISFIKQYNSTAKIIVGGPHISNQTKVIDLTVHQMFKYIGADFYVTCQEGEHALVEIIRALKDSTDLGAIENIAYKKGTRYVTTISSTESNPLEENLVNYSLFPKDDIGEFISTRTAKSCPFACAFCGFPERAGKYLYLDVDYVERELDAISSVGGVTTLTFLDDTFNVPKGRFKEILRMMIKKRYGFKWNCFYRCDHGDEEAIQLMGEAGCEGVFLGAESGSDKMLTLMNKTARRKDYLKAIPLLKEAGISTYTSLIIGFPGETTETIHETIDFIEEGKPDFFRAQLWYADPITPVWKRRDEFKIKGGAFNWSHLSMDSKTACDWIDHIFLCIEGSTWLPQFGFEQWSTFYLQRKGMTLDRIKLFLNCFNSALKEKLIYRNQKSITSGILDSLKTSCRFDKAELPDVAALAPVSGNSYKAAERFWTNEFKAASAYPVANRTGASQADEWNTAMIRLEPFTVEGLRNNFGDDLAVPLMSAYAGLLSPSSDEENISVAAAFGGEEGVTVIPLNIPLSGGSSYKEIATGIEEKIRLGLEHKTFAFHILANPIRMAINDSHSPTFFVGFTYRDESGKPSRISMKDELEWLPEVKNALGIILNAALVNETIQIELDYLSHLFDSEDINKACSNLVSTLEQMSRGEEPFLLSRLIDNGDALATITDSAEAFNF